MNEKPIENRGEIIIYRAEDNTVQLDVRMENETVWLSQQQMVQLFNSTKQNISLHIGNIFREGELQKEATVKEYLTVQTEGNRQICRKVLDVIISGEIDRENENQKNSTNE